MSKKQKITALVMSTLLVFASVFVTPISTNEAQAVSLTKQQAINKYYSNQDSYNKHEVPLIKGFEQGYDGSLAHQVVARAIWYMEHGYMIYNFAGGYPTNGLIDCSNFTQLVYRDFGIQITSRSRDYNKVGTRVAGVSSTRVGTNYSGQPIYGIKGIENLRPGDILNYWAGPENDKYISHVAIYMGIINGKPAVINTASNRPTALGIVNNFSYWYGEKFLEARRILPNDAWDSSAASKYSDRGPVIPTEYYLPPQKPIVMPNNQVYDNTDEHSNTDNNDVKTPVIGQVRVTGNVVNVRSGPGSEYSILGVIRNGDVVDVIGQSDRWVNILLADGSSGFVAEWLVSSIDTTGSETIDSPSTEVQISQVTGNVVYVRSAATTNSDALGVVRNGDEVIVTKQLEGWYEIDFHGQTAYIASFLLSNPTSSTIDSTATMATVTGGIVNLRSGAGTNHSILTVVHRGDTVEVISTSDNWSKVKFGSTTGYMASWLLSLS